MDVRFGRWLQFWAGALGGFGVAGVTVSADLVQTNDVIGWQQQGEWVWRYQFARDADLPSLDVLRIPGGLPLLAQPGMSFRWVRINGVSDGGDALAVGRVAWKHPAVEVLPDGGAVIRQRIDYLDPSGRREIAEYRDLVFSPVERNGKYTVDWTSHFTAGEAGARLEDDADGVSGLTLFLDGGSEPIEYVTLPPAAGADPADSMEPQTQGVATLMYPNDRHPGSVAMLADPRSTVGPHRWVFSRDDASRSITAALLQSGPRQLEPGEVWEISYRLVVRPKQWDRDDLRLELFRWLSR